MWIYSLQRKDNDEQQAAQLLCVGQRGQNCPLARLLLQCTEGVGAAKFEGEMPILYWLYIESDEMKMMHSEDRNGSKDGCCSTFRLDCLPRALVASSTEALRHGIFPPPAQRFSYSRAAQHCDCWYDSHTCAV